MNNKLKTAIYVIIVIIVFLCCTKEINLFNEKFYKNIKQIEDPTSILVIVNKIYKLPIDYVPSDLEMINVKYSNSDKYLRKIAKEAFEELSKDAKKEGYSIVAVSAYRDYNYQDNLYQEYVTTMGIDYADSCSARAGHSEHQTGLAVDVKGSNDDYNLFEDSKEFIWMKNNSYKYGFILRYPKGKEKITGFKYEPWHYRKVNFRRILR